MSRSINSPADSRPTSSNMFSRVRMAGCFPSLSPKGKLAQSRRNRPRLFWSCVAGLLLIVMLIPALVCGLYFGLAHEKKSSIPLTVDLGYSKYQGSNVENGVTQWLGIRYAAAPVGDLRFRAPRDPTANTTLQIANKVCISVFGFISTNQNSMGLFATAHRRHGSTQANQKTVSS